MQTTIPATAKTLGLEVEEFPQYLDSDDVSKEIPRYVWFPGDIISPRRKLETREMVGIGLSINGRPFHVTANGGDEFQTAALTRTKGFVPRAFIAPLEVAANWIPPELLPYGASAFRANATNGAQVAGGVLVGTKSQYLVGEKVYPGHAINWMLSFARNNGGYSRGLVEIEALRGQEWSGGAASELQALYFPNYPEIPNLLSEMSAQIEVVKKAQSGTVREIGDLMLMACDEYRDWGLAFIAEEHNLVKVGTTDGGWTYRYSDTARLLMEQLEVTPSDQQFQTVAKMQEEMGRVVMESLKVKGGDQSDMMKLFLDNQKQIADALTAIAGNQNQTAKAEPKEEARPKGKQDK